MVQLVQCLLLIAIVTTAIGGESNAHLNCLSSELSEELSSSAPVLQSKSAKLQVLDTVSSLESDSTTANALSEAESDETVSGTIFETMSDAAFETISMSESITLSETMSDTVSDASPAGFFPVLALNGSLLVAGQMLAMEDNITELFITLQQNYQLLKDEYHLNNSYYHWVTGSLLVTIVLLLLFYREARTHFASYEFAMRDLYKGLSPEGGTHWEYTNNPLNNKVRQTIETEVGDYHPPWWYSPSLGTLVSFGKNLRLNYETDLFRNNSHHFDMQYNSSDWEFTVDWYPSKPNPKEGTVHKIILFFPGLGLGSKNVSLQFEFPCIVTWIIFPVLFYAFLPVL